MTMQPTVFIVDDDEEARESVRALVKSLGARCEVYANAEDFLTAYDPAQPGCLLSDLRMHGMGGLEMCEEITRRGWTIPVVIVSGYINNHHGLLAEQHGIEVLTKPYSGEELWEAIQRALREDALRRARPPRE